MDVPEQADKGAQDIDELRARVTANPNELLPLLELGWSLYGHKKISEAVEKLEQAVKRFPDDPEAHYALGLAYKQAGANEKAQQSFQRVIESIEHDPEKVRASMMLKLAKRQMNHVQHGTWELTS